MKFVRVCLVAALAYGGGAAVSAARMRAVMRHVAHKQHTKLEEYRARFIVDPRESERAQLLHALWIGHFDNADRAIGQ